MGWLADHFPQKQVMLLTYLWWPPGFHFCFWAATHFSVYASATMFGIGLGGDYMIIPLMTAEIFGVRIWEDCWE